MKHNKLRILFSIIYTVEVLLMICGFISITFKDQLTPFAAVGLVAWFSLIFTAWIQIKWLGDKKFRKSMKFKQPKQFRPKKIKSRKK